jgi:dTDP-4-amino-4,6-dideoxygalactose transaminase/RimJ/RimL family protein N-acetyltransferase
VSERLRLRRITPEDARLLFEWRNRPEIVALGSQQRTVTWQEHAGWFEGALREQERFVQVIELDHAPAGQIRFDLGPGGDAVVSIYLLAEHTGQGLGVVALRAGCAEAFAHWPVERVVAFVRADNRASQVAFAKAGFEPLTGAALAELPVGHLAVALPRPAAVPHNRLTHDEREAEAAATVVRSGQWSAGARVAELEGVLAAMAGVRGAVCVGSGLSALRLGLLGLGVRSSDSVVMPAYSCVALANAALAIGARPIAVDVRDADLNLDPAAVAALGAAPRAIIAVHTFGVSADVARLSATGPVLEDCSHAFGRDQRGARLGSRGRAAIISLYATKLLGGGQGGAVLSNDEALLECVRDYREYADKPASGLRLNDQMTDLCAAIALCQAQKLPELLRARHELAERYHAQLGRHHLDADVVQLPEPDEDRIWYRYAVTMRRPCAREIIEELARRGVQAARPIDEWSADLQSACPVASRAYQSVVSLPLYPSLRQDEQERVVYAFVQACRSVAA